MKAKREYFVTAVVVLLLYSTLEWFALPIFYRTLAPIAWPLLGTAEKISLQKSKQGLVPKNYIALIGDSYASGLGDWYYETTGNINAISHSAHLIHNGSGRDVISFGGPGSGSIRGMISEPLSQLAMLEAQGITFENPDTILVYFYEGNDFSDNIRYLKQANNQRRKLDYAQISNPHYFSEYINDVAIEQDQLYQQAQNLAWYDKLLMGKFIIKASAGIFATLLKDNTPPADGRSPLNHQGRYEWIEPGTINLASVNGVEINLPDRLQGPAMELTDEEKQIALDTFEQSLLFLRKTFPDTHIGILYIPSVATCYTIRSTQLHLQGHLRQKQELFDTQQTLEQAQWMASQIEAISSQQGVPFLDASPWMKRAASQQLIHGPLDWNHPNRHGYTALSEAALKLLEALPE